MGINNKINGIYLEDKETSKENFNKTKHNKAVTPWAPTLLSFIISKTRSWSS